MMKRASFLLAAAAALSCCLLLYKALSKKPLTKDEVFDSSEKNLINSWQLPDGDSVFLYDYGGTHGKIEHKQLAFVSKGKNFRMVNDTTSCFYSNFITKANFTKNKVTIQLYINDYFISDTSLVKVHLDTVPPYEDGLNK